MVVSIAGPKGELNVETRGNVTVAQEDGRLIVKRHGDEKSDRAFHGLYHRLLVNAVRGVTEGYSRELEIKGTGYKAEQKGPNVNLIVGWSHGVLFQPPPGVTVQAPEDQRLVVTGIDKQAVHQVAAQLRAIRPPEPYKGKGIRYKGEAVRQKVGKTGVK
jgi:large subunit ribosomal protein L6